MTWARGIASGILVLAAFSPAFGADIHVSPGGSISAAVASAQSGDRVLVEEGTYYESVSLKGGVALRGGYDSSFSEGSRDRDAHPTTIHGGDVSAAIVSGPGIGSDTVVDGLRFTGGGGTPGAGVVITGGAPVFRNNEIFGNHHAGLAGGVYIRGGSSALIDDNDFVDNSSDGSGGGLRVENSSPTITSNTFVGCLAPNSGGGLYVVLSSMQCDNNIFTDCRARDGFGGGMFIQSCGDDAVLDGNIFNGCSAAYGGGMGIKDECSPQVTDTVFRDCSATISGGGMAIFGGDLAGPTVSSFLFEDCSSLKDGGGLYVGGSLFTRLGDDATEVVPSGAFTRCEAVNGYGGGLATYQAIGTVESVRFTDCETTGWGGGIYLFQSDVTVQLCIIERCVAAEGGGINIHTDTTLISPQSSILNCTIHECEATDAEAQRPAAGITVAAVQSANIALVAGCIVSNSVAGAAVRCRRGSTTVSQTGQPTIHCSSFHRVPSNTIEVISGARCLTAYNSGALNLRSDVDAYVPEYCQAIPVRYSIKTCSLDANSNCGQALPSRVNRGANETVCSTPCGVFSIEPMSWGEIKARYR